MVPILTHNTLQKISQKFPYLAERETDLNHAVFDRVLWVWVRAAALAVNARKVLVVGILDILLLCRKELTGLSKSGSAITAEVTLCVKLNLQCFEDAIIESLRSTSV